MKRKKFCFYKDLSLKNYFYWRTAQNSLALPTIDDNILKEAQKIKMKNKQVPKEEMMVHTSRNTNRNKKNDEEIEKEEDEKKEKNKPDQDKDE